MTKLDPRGLDFELYFLSEVLQLTSFHYGYWDAVPDRARIGLEDLRRAQSRYTDALISVIPDGVNSVLDVGAGTGDSARALARRGYDVVAISPDENHQKYFVDCTEPPLRFQRSIFEDYETSSRFDLLYFSESINYIDREAGLRQSLRLAKPSGYLLVCGTFRSEDHQPYPDDFDLSQLPYVVQAEAMGMELVQALDITENVRPTVWLAHKALSRFTPALLEMSNAFIRRQSAFRRIVLGWTLGRARHSFMRATAKYLAETDPEYFGRHMRYVTLLLRTPDRVRAAPAEPPLVPPLAASADLRQ